MRSRLIALLALAAPLLAGCPMWGDDGCHTSSDCPRGSYCREDGACVALSPGGGGYEAWCELPGDCGPNSTCGADYLCHAGDCTYPGTGCPAGWVCAGTPDLGWSCTQAAPGDGGADAGDAADAPGEGGDAEIADADAATDGDGAPEAGDAAAAIRCGNPADCAGSETCASDGTCHAGDCSQSACIAGFVCRSSGGALACVRSDPAACGIDADCGSATLRCVDGACSPLASLCSDRSQCAPSHACVDGKCVATCATDGDCAAGFACAASLGACTGAASSCAKTSDCARTDEVCVAGACVARCPSAGCGAGSACVDDGCVPGAARVTSCATEGAQDACAPGEICVHGACYASCSATTPCTGALDQCKAITTSTSTYSVCGAATTLGTECDPTQGAFCGAGKACVDGFCR